MRAGPPAGGGGGELGTVGLRASLDSSYVKLYSRPCAIMECAIKGGFVGGGGYLVAGLGKRAERKKTTQKL